MKKENDVVVFEYLYREKDHVTVEEDGLRTLRLLLKIGRRNHIKFLKKQHNVKSKKVLDEWSKHLLFADKIIEKLFFGAKKVTVEVDWNKWEKLEKELTKEMKKINR
jgi:hypothetical protein